jgi:D-3-phosphoglycerate dehydrogenase
MKFVAYDPYVKQAPAGGPEIKMVELDELLKVSDFITIHIPKTAETTGLLGKAAFSQVKPTVHIINAARGGVVDEDALFEALIQGQVAGAGLDVYATEPSTDSPLFALDQVVATPHLGASTEEAQEKAGIAVAQSVVAFFSGNEVPGAVNTAQLK